MVYVKKGGPAEPKKKGPTPGGPFTQISHSKRGANLSFRCSHFGAPLIKPPFHPGEQLHTDHPSQRENEDADEDFVGLECGARDCDHKTNSGGSSIKLPNHDTHDSPPKPQPQTRKNERDSRRQYDGPKEHPLRSAKAPRGTEKI